jgi:molybdopterin synthase catalytic subunit
MLHTKIIDTQKEQIKISDAEQFIASSKFGANIYFTGTVRNLMIIKK